MKTREKKDSVKRMLKIFFFDYLLIEILFGSMIFGYFFIWRRDKIKVIGKENIPRIGTIILYGNHPSMMDPVLMYGKIFLPKAIFKLSSIPLSLAAVENFLMDNCRRIPVLGKIPILRDMPLLKLAIQRFCIPVKEGRDDPQALKKVLRAIKEGRNILIFPEGHRTSKGNEIDSFQLGIAQIYLLANVDAVIPFRIKGDAKKILPKGQDWPDWSKGKITVTFGKDINNKLIGYKTKFRYRLRSRKTLRDTIARKMRQEVLDL